jgi:enediyne biosynthesis protein E4
MRPVGRRLRPIAASVVVLVALGGVFAAARFASAPNHPSQAMCADVAAQVGLDFRGAYGTTVIPTPMGAMMQRNMGNGAAVGDYDNDGALDVYLLGQNGHPNRLFHNELARTGGKRFRDVTDEAGVGDPGLSRVADFADLDGDGLLDLVVLDDTDPGGKLPPSRLYRNLGDGRFADVTQESGFSPVGYIVGGASLADVDGDGRLDIYVSYWTEELAGDPGRLTIQGPYPAENKLFHNEGGFHFRDVTADSGLNGIRRDTFSSVFANFAGHGMHDLYVAVDHREDLYYEQVGPLLWQNRSGTVGATHTGNDMGVAAADLENDGGVDLFVTNITDPTGNFGTTQGNVLWHVRPDPKAGARFEDRTLTAGASDTAWGWGTAFFDADLDGRLDLFAAQGMQEFIGGTSEPLREARAKLFLGTDTGRFAEIKGTGCDVPGDQRAVIPFDYDRDGDEDLLVTQVGLHVMLIENRTEGRSITVDLADGRAAAAGSRVSVTADGRTVTRILLAGGSYLAGPPMEAVFGLGNATSADAVRVAWSNGRTTEVRHVAAGTVLRLAP